jgi:hypothetical protein
MPVPLDVVLRALRQFPDGATAQQLADKLGCERDGLGSRLSKQFLYGGPVDREKRAKPQPVGRQWTFVWRAR